MRILTAYLAGGTVPIHDTNEQDNFIEAFNIGNHEGSPLFIVSNEPKKIVLRLEAVTHYSLHEQTLTDPSSPPKPPGASHVSSF